MINDIGVEPGRFWVDDYPGEDGLYLIMFALDDVGMKQWAEGMKFKPFHDQPTANPEEDQWMVVGDRKTVATFKLVWGGK